MSDKTKTGHGYTCDPGCGCRGNAIPATYLLMQRLAVEEMAQVLIDHTRIDGIHGDCSCGHIVPPGRSFAAHQATALRASILGGAA